MCSHEGFQFFRILGRVASLIIVEIDIDGLENIMVLSSRFLNSALRTQQLLLS